MNTASWTIESVTNFVGANTKLELQLHDLDDLLNRIKTQDEKMQSYLSNYHHLERFTLEGFAHWITAQDTMSVQGLMDRIHLLVVGSTDLENVGNVGVLQLLANRMEVIDFISHGDILYCILLNATYLGSCQCMCPCLDSKYTLVCRQILKLNRIITFSLIRKPIERTETQPQQNFCIK